MPSQISRISGISLILLLQRLQFYSMSARLGSKTVNKCYQSMRMASRVLYVVYFNNIKNRKPKMMPMNKMCRQQFKDTPSYNEYCRLSKQMAKCANTYHIRPSEVIMFLWSFL